MFENKNKIPFVTGINCIAENSALLRTFGKKCLIVTGASSAKACGALDDVTAALESEGIRYAVYSRIGQNPLLSDCFRGGEKAREEKAEFLIGIGGGSPMDACKAISLYASNPGLTPRDIYRLQYDKEGLPFVLVGTTAGTGSEATAVSVLTADETNMKKSIKCADTYADLVFADPKYTYTLPWDITVSTALDAFSHAVEAFLSPLADDTVFSAAEKALPILFAALKALNRGELPDQERRNAVFSAAIYAGMAIDVCGTAFPHAFGYILTESWGIPHGKACTAFLPALVRHTMDTCPDRTQALFQILNCDFQMFREPVEALTGCVVKMTRQEISSYMPRFAMCKNFENVQGGYCAARAEELFKALFLN